MPKPIKSQWDFGELFAPEQTRRVLTVSELTTQVKRLLEQHVGTVWVTGEITNLRIQSSGHVYFTLKDAATQLACVCFRSAAAVQRDLLQEGRKVVLQGDVTVYEPRGQYQLIVRQAELHGLGALQAAFERLKQKLAAEGLFDPARKRPLPRFPSRMGLVTSPTGAAIRDVLHVVERRNPGLEIILAPCRVQGQGAAEEIAGALALLNEYNSSLAAHEAALDLILVTRGGGSLEDLWAFNEEVVARAIAASAVPVVSAVGHEIDFTIADFVADLRAATPSVAAEIVTDGVYSSRVFVTQATGRLLDLCRRQCNSRRDQIEAVVRRFLRMHPRRRLDVALQRLDELQGRVGRRGSQSLRQGRMDTRQLAQRLHQVRPSRMVVRHRELADRLRARLIEQVWQRTSVFQSSLDRAIARLRLLGPEQVLARGYSITMDAASGAIVRDAVKVQHGQRLKTRLRSGEVTSVVDK